MNFAWKYDPATRRFDPYAQGPEARTLIPHTNYGAVIVHRDHEGQFTVLERGASVTWKAGTVLKLAGKTFTHADLVTPAALREYPTKDYVASRVFVYDHTTRDFRPFSEGVTPRRPSPDSLNLDFFVHINEHDEVTIVEGPAVRDWPSGEMLEFDGKTFSRDYVMMLPTV